MRDKNQSFQSNFDGLLYSVLYVILPPFLYAKGLISSIRFKGAYTDHPKEDSSV